MYDTATTAPPGARGGLYPSRDRCDLSLDADGIGIDVKSHANPFLLAASLNPGVGGLELYSTKVIAINDQAISRFPEYLEILRHPSAIDPMCRVQVRRCAAPRAEVRA